MNYDKDSRPNGVDTLFHYNSKPVKSKDCKKQSRRFKHEYNK